ncbi:hypothetical protein N657DRAFT_648570 [Parathielavia appendiculata]|uniref:Uncharacterized protein n=1 Tax=Parathielavia appendiculata TaxID=2587402 RepID=A0AAN6TU49_9PEZI|nr:hypothetical protein N657DRAFT_648570 [Parathielavia appendiculata]
MSSQSKVITIGLILALGIGNAYYTFNPSLKELKERREGSTIGKTLEPQTPAAPQPEAQQDKPS